MPVLQTKPGDKQISGVTLAQSGRAYDKELLMVGAALFQKTVVFKVKVSVEQLFLSAPEKFVRTDVGAASSVLLSEVVAETTTFLRTVESTTVRVQLDDTASANGLDNDPDVNKIGDALIALGETFAQGETVAMVLKNGSACTLTIETMQSLKSSTVVGGADFGRKVVSLLLGNPLGADGAKTKEELLAFKP